MVKIKREHYKDIIQYAAKGLPHEVCGLIGGRKLGDVREIERIYYLKNLDQSNEHFTMDPKEQFQAVKEMRAEGFEPLGNFHSHPETPARPSEEDIKLAYDSDASYLIASLAVPEHPEIKAFRIAAGVSVTDELIIQ